MKIYATSYFNVKIINLTVLLLLISGLVCAQTESIEKILNSDGTIKEGENGSYNISGYSLEFGANNEPRLIQSDRLNKAKGNSSVTWSSFGSGYNGVDNQVKTIAVIGTDIYIG
ncbi:MAG TPA: hypothetical protein PL041_15810 [Melioribacteraceae bacterium]|nr:hypothetical protein [Melioribacteraceae bacterium]